MMRHHYLFNESNKPLFQALRVVGHLSLQRLKQFLTEDQIEELMVYGLINKEEGYYQYKKYTGYYLTGPGQEQARAMYGWLHFYRRQGFLHDLTLAKVFLSLSETEQSRAMTQNELFLNLIEHIPFNESYPWIGERDCPDFGCVLDSGEFKCFEVHSLLCSTETKSTKEEIASELGASFISRNIGQI